MDCFYVVRSFLVVVDGWVGLVAGGWWLGGGEGHYYNLFFNALGKLIFFNLESIHVLRVIVWLLANVQTNTCFLGLAPPQFQRVNVCVSSTYQLLF